MTQEKYRMNIENYILEAIEMVSAWEVPAEELADAINDQARLMAGVSIDDIRERPSDTP